MGTVRRLAIGLVLGSLLANLQLAPPLASHVSAAACNSQNLHYADSFPSGADGAREEWTLRTLSATDWDGPGFAAEVLWVGTDGQDTGTTWVEVGVTKGWESQNIYRYYTANAINFPAYYDQRLFNQIPVVGTTTLFYAYAVVGGSYTAKIASAVGSPFFSETWTWPNHAAPTVEYAGGLESTCSTNRVDRTYVSVHQYRKQSTGVYTDPTSSAMVHVGSPGNSAWCTAPTKFRYWINSQIATNLCS